MKRKLFSILLCISLVVSLAVGCASGDSDSNEGSEEASTDEAQEIKLAFAFADYEENIAIFYGYAEDALKALEEKYDVDISLQYTDAGGDVQTQLSDVDNLIVQQMDAIAIACVDPDGSLPAFEACEEAGIAYAAFMIPPNDREGLNIIEPIPFSNYDIGVLQAEWLISYMDENPDEEIYIGFINAPDSVGEENLLREVGFRETIEADGRAQIVETLSGDRDVNKYISVAEDMMQSHPEINCFVGYSDDEVIGASSAITTAGGDPINDYLLIGVDASTYLDKIKDGTINCSIKMNNALIMSNLTECMVIASMGDEIPDSLLKDIEDALITVTKDNASEWE